MFLVLSTAERSAAVRNLLSWKLVRINDNENAEDSSSSADIHSRYIEGGRILLERLSKIDGDFRDFQTFPNPNFYVGFAGH